MGLPLHPAPKVTLLSAPVEPYNTAMAAARTCYNGKIVTAQEVGATPQARDQRDRIAQSTFEAGHHTVWQHAHFTFALSQVSRQVLWSFLHSHPFYNSEQVSQRYVEVKAGHFTVPALPTDFERQLFVSTVAEMHKCYQDLTADLMATAGDAFFAVFPARRRKSADYTKEIKKKAQEIARYALPVCTHAHLYHTVSALTLYRMWRLCGQLDVPDEARALVGAMVDAVKAHDGDLWKNAPEPLLLEDTLEMQVLAKVSPGEAGQGAAFCKEFDARLDGRVSKLECYSQGGPATVAHAVRQMLGLTQCQLEDDRAIDYLLDPEQNAYLGSALNLTTHAKLTRALHHVSYVFRKKLSHTADSQDQRHRMIPGSRPVLARQVDLAEADVIVPGLLARNERAHTRYVACMDHVWDAMRQLHERGVDPSAWTYLLPNAFPVRFTESGDLLHHHHKWTSRLCFTAQEEIWRASVDEVEQVAQVHPTLGKWLLPPCGLRQRAKVTPYCPEGPRYCGVPVWKQQPADYVRVI